MRSRTELNDVSTPRWLLIYLKRGAGLGLARPYRCFLEPILGQMSTTIKDEEYRILLEPAVCPTTASS